MTQSRVSTIIPCYNGERFLAEAIESALGQTHADHEVIVVDDGSTDGSQPIMESYSSRVKIVSQANSGLPAARNAGIKVCTGHYIAFLDADDYWRPDFLEKMLARIEAEVAGITYCGWQNIGLPGGRGEPYVPPDYEAEPNKVQILFKNACWPVHAALTRRELVEASGGFDPKWKSCEDFAFWLQTVLRCRIARVPEVLAFYRHHDHGQMTNKRAVIGRSRYLVQKEFIEQNPQIKKILGSSLRELMEGMLLKTGYECYWDRDMDAARELFRMVMSSGYGNRKDWMYMLPSLLPKALHVKLIHFLGR